MQAWAFSEPAHRKKKKHGTPKLERANKDTSFNSHLDLCVIIVLLCCGNANNKFLSSLWRQRLANMFELPRSPITVVHYVLRGLNSLSLICLFTCTFLWPCHNNIMAYLSRLHRCLELSFSSLFVFLPQPSTPVQWWQ